MSGGPINLAPAEAHPPTSQRNFGGWVILALLFALLFWTELGSSITNAATAKMDDFQYTLKTIVESEPPPGKAAGSLDAFSDPKSELKLLESELADQKKLDDLGREVYAAVLTEEKKPVPQKLYGPLLSSKSLAVQAFGRVYAPGKLTLAEARSVQVRLQNSKDFVAKLASAQAMERAGDTKARAELLPSSSRLLKSLLPLTFLGLAGASLFVWCGYLAARSGGELRPLGMLNRSLTPYQADLFAIRAAQVFCVWLVVNIVSAEAFGKGSETQAPSMFLQGVLTLAAVPMLFRLPLGPGLPTLAGLGVTKENLGRNILWGLAGFAAEIPVSVLLSLVVMAVFRFLPTPQHPAEQELQQTTNPVTIAAILFLGTIVAAFWEEILFRGLLFPALGRLCKSIPVGALVSSLIFASIHPQGAAVWPSLCVVGLMSCGLTYQTRSLVPSMVMHFCHNAVLLMLTVQWGT